MADKNKLEVTLALIDKATAPLQAFARRVEAFKAPIQKVSNKLAMFGEAAGFGKLHKAAGGVAHAVGDVASEVGSLATKIVSSVGVVGLALFGLVKMTSNAADSFDELSTKAGVSASYFQKAAYAASFASVANEDLAGSLAKMNANMIEAIGGGKEQILWFKRAGLSVADLRKMKPEQVFDRVMESVKKLPKESAKAGSLMKGIFGKSGTNLLPMVEGFKELTEEAEKLGLVLSDADVKAGAEFNDTFDKMVKVLKGIGMMLGSILMPYFKEAISAVTEWALANRELIKVKVGEWIARLKEHWPEIKQGALDAWQAMKGFVDFIKGAVAFFGGLENTLKLVAVVIAGPLLIAIGSLVKAVWLLGAAIGGTPIGWFLAAVMAIGLAAKLVYDNWEPIKAFFIDLWGGIKQVVSDALTWFVEVLSWHPLALIANNWEPIKTFFVGLWDDISKIFSDNIKKLTGWMDMLNPARALGAAFDWGKGLVTGGGPATGAATGAAGVAASMGPTTKTNNAAVTVDFKNAPRGTEVTPSANNTAPLDLSMGYAGVTF
jgi:hypothetical protein